MTIISSSYIRLKSPRTLICLWELDEIVYISNHKTKYKLLYKKISISTWTGCLYNDYVMKSLLTFSVGRLVELNGVLDETRIAERWVESFRAHVHWVNLFPLAVLARPVLVDLKVAIFFPKGARQRILQSYWFIARSGFTLTDRGNGLKRSWWHCRVGQFSWIN